LGGFSPRVRTVRLQGGVAQLSPEKDHRTSVEGRIAMSPFGNGLLQSLRTGGIQEMDREGGNGP
jgi:hypothetical protein